jgi:hypothetical protein
VVSSYTFQSQKIAAGEMTIVVITNVGSSLIQVADKAFFRIERLARVIEESGYGGVIKIDDAEFEVFDKSGYFKDSIFDAGVTTAEIQVSVVASSVTTYLFKGSIDFSTIEWNEVFTDRWNIRFTAFSVLKKLEDLTSFTDFRTAVDALAVTVPFANLYQWDTRVANPTSVDFIKFADLLEVFQAELDNSVSSTSSSTARFQCPGISIADALIADLYIPFSRLDGAATAYCWSFADGADDINYQGLLSSKSNWFEILKFICAQFGQAVLLAHNGTGWQIKVVQRGEGDVVAPTGVIKSKIRTKFQGYDAFKVATYIGPEAGGTFAEQRARYNIPGNAQSYDEAENKYDVPMSFEFEVPNSYGARWTHPSKLWLRNGNSWRAVYQVTDSSFTPARAPYYTMNPWLADKIVSRWGNSRSSPRTTLEMYELRYGGLELALDINDQIEIDSDNYTIIEINRNIAEDETTVKAVNY